jgi:hypothetical protein
MPQDQAADAGYQDLLGEKAQRLTDLLNRKPGQKGYKRSLRAFLEADAAAQRALLAQIDQAGDAPTARAVSSSDADPHPPE